MNEDIQKSNASNGCDMDRPMQTKTKKKKKRMEQRMHPVACETDYAEFDSVVVVDCVADALYRSCSVVVDG